MKSQAERNNDNRRRASARASAMRSRPQWTWSGKWLAWLCRGWRS